MAVPMGTPPASREQDRQRADRSPPLRVRIRWPDDPPPLDHEAEMLDGLFGETIRNLFQGTS